MATWDTQPARVIDPHGHHELPPEPPAAQREVVTIRWTLADQLHLLSVVDTLALAGRADDATFLITVADRFAKSTNVYQAIADLERARYDAARKGR